MIKIKTNTRTRQTLYSPSHPPRLILAFFDKQQSEKILQLRKHQIPPLMSRSGHRWERSISHRTLADAPTSVYSSTVKTLSVVDAGVGGRSGVAGGGWQTMFTGTARRGRRRGLRDPGFLALRDLFTTRLAFPLKGLIRVCLLDMWGLFVVCRVVPMVVVEEEDE